MEAAHRERPNGRAAGYQRWRGLLFLHWRIAADQLRPLVPEELEIDTYQGDAWVGMVPFAMDRIRPWWSPSVPGISWFLETNLRTYVRCAGANPGVWFFSLEASNPLAVAIARRCWHLNYHFARLQMHVRPDAVRYASLGRRGGAAADYEIDVKLPAPLNPSSAAPGTLEYFLVERYRMYTKRRDGTLMSGRVFHRPYEFGPVTVSHCRQRLTCASGIVLNRACDHAVYSPQVDVEVFPLSATWA